MKILVINGGSSSIKTKVIDVDTMQCIQDISRSEVKDYSLSLEEIFNEINNLEEIKIFAHRVVHGGNKYSKATIIDDDVIKDIQELSSLAPLHNPVNLKAIIYIKNKMKNATQVAVFDTAFHQSIPAIAHTYALPYELYEKYNIKKYGFHGTSHKYLVKQSAIALNKDQNKLNLITLHLGNGASITAIKNGKSIDTSMGFTPLEGLIMGTRSGDIDPQIIFWLQENTNLSYGDIKAMLNKKSGLLGIAQESNVKELGKKYNNNDKLAILALDMFAYRIKKYIGSYREVLGKIDAIIVSGGIGENSHLVRSLIFNNIGDKQENDKTYYDIGLEEKILVIKTNEELQIAIESYEEVKNKI